MAEHTQRSLNRICTAFRAQLNALAASSAQLDRYQLGRLMHLVNGCLADLDSVARSAPMTLAEYVLEHSLGHDAIKHEIEGEIGDDPALVLAKQVQPAAGELSDILATADLPDQVAGRFGAVRTTDYLRTGLIVAVDIALATYGKAERPSLAEALRTLTQVIAERYPGQTIEVRVPPYAAVQVGALSTASAHRRGTPPNVVELTPTAFWQLATGRSTWEQIKSGSELTSSGIHADETARMFPILRLA
ncbi:sterol carrier family protein [Propionimicrobium sp. PCR01-08-3]|uniref:sterol carrier family protein n=1 Tax=Propionimicrobium sp. PCR01-08-3 TaxID=3052086 RepID=UPI00255C300E|nr:sterol carrier family protein [Propionimicrobium sp. PCR01-08-3]WIY81754.1 sterol carrier family protein [Propionimicrobium sp. PCR01-08-3]